MEEALAALFQWFDNNLLEQSPKKRHLLIRSNEKIAPKIGEYQIESSESEKLLGVILDLKLNFDDHISGMCKKTRGKLNALVRITSFIILNLVISPDLDVPQK